MSEQNSEHDDDDDDIDHGDFLWQAFKKAKSEYHLHQTTLKENQSLRE